MEEITRCQEDILAAGAHPEYAERYRAAELFYWVYIAKWLYDLSRSSTRVTRVLDIGPAHGTLSLFCKRMFNCQVYCVDPWPLYMSDAFKEKYGFTFALNNIERDPFPWKMQFDVIVFTEVIEHLNFQPVPTLKKIAGLLAPRGKLFLSTPDAKEWGRMTKYYARLSDIPMPNSAVPITYDHVWQYSKDELFEVVQEAGLTVDRYRYSPGRIVRHFNLQLSFQERSSDPRA